MPAGTILLVESASVYSGGAGVETKSEFTMRTKDRELVTRYSTDIDNTIKQSYWPQGGTGTVSGSLPVFETDSNGMLMMERVTNKTHWRHNESYFHGALHLAAPPSHSLIQSDLSSCGRRSVGGCRRQLLPPRIARRHPHQGRRTQPI